MRGKSYHVEDNGEVIFFKNLQTDKLPKEYTSTIKSGIPDSTELTLESDFNKMIKHKKQKGLIKDVSIATLQHQND